MTALGPMRRPRRASNGALDISYYRRRARRLRHLARKQMLRRLCVVILSLGRRSVTARATAPASGSAR